MTDHKVHLDIDKLNKIFPRAYFNMFFGNIEYDNPDEIVVTADWNNVPQAVYAGIERLENFTCEWLNEWTQCYHCSGAIRTSPDSYHWQSKYVILEDEGFVCINCLEDCIEEYFKSIENNPKHALTHPIFDKYNPEDYGYKLIDDSFENGFYEGQNDNPQDILKKALENNPNGRFLFAMTNQGQFDVDFSLYCKVASEE